MHSRPTTAGLLTLFLLPLLIGCGSEETKATVVVGLTTDLAVGFDIADLEITMVAGNQAVHEEKLSYNEGKLVLPKEIIFDPLANDAEIDITIDAFHESLAPPLISRRAKTQAQAGQTLFLPLSLHEACIGVLCNLGDTCIDGICKSPFFPPESLAEYRANWFETAEDACKYNTDKPASLVIGQGASDFTPLKAGEIVHVEAGPQGGHHVWTALRMRGVRQLGSILTVSGTFPNLPYSLPPYQWIVTLRKAPEDQCELYGIRFQVDRGIPLESILGEPFSMQIELQDSDNTKLSATQLVTISQ